MKEDLNEIMEEMAAWLEQVEQQEYEARQEEAREIYATMEVK